MSKLQQSTQTSSKQSSHGGVHGGRASYPHFKYNFITGSGHYSMGAARGPYGWSKEKENEQELKAMEMLRRLSSENLTESNAMGLGYGKAHASYYRYLNRNNGDACKGINYVYPKLTCRNAHGNTTAAGASTTPAPSSSQTIRRPNTAPAAPLTQTSTTRENKVQSTKRVTGWLDDSQDDETMSINQLNFAASLGYGGRHACRSIYLHRPYPPNLAEWKPRPATAINKESLPNCCTGSTESVALPSIQRQ